MRTMNTAAQQVHEVIKGWRMAGLSEREVKRLALSFAAKYRCVSQGRKKQAEKEFFNKVASEYKGASK